MDSSENSTTLLGMPTYPDRSSSLWLDPISCRLVSPLSRVDSAVRRPSPTPNFPVPLSHSLTGVPFLLPVTPRSQVQNPLSCFAPKQTKESSAWWTTYIVLQIESFQYHSDHKCNTLKVHSKVNHCKLKKQLGPCRSTIINEIISNIT